MTQNCHVWGYEPFPESFGNRASAYRERIHLTTGVMLDSVNRHAEGDEDYSSYTLETLMERNGDSSIDILMVVLGGDEFSLQGDGATLRGQRTRATVRTTSD